MVSKLRRILLENVMREVLHITPTASTGGSQPFPPWAIAASIFVVALLVLGYRILLIKTVLGLSLRL